MWISIESRLVGDDLLLTVYRMHVQNILEKFCQDSNLKWYQFRLCEAQFRLCQHKIKSLFVQKSIRRVSERKRKNKYTNRALKTAYKCLCRVKPRSGRKSVYTRGFGTHSSDYSMELVRLVALHYESKHTNTQVRHTNMCMAHEYTSKLT